MATLACFSTMAAMTSTAAAQELLGYWKFEEADLAGDAMDSSGNEMHGTFDGDVELGLDGPEGFGSAAYFDGVTAQVLLGPGDENGLGELTEEFSVMAWINPEDFGSKNRVMGSAPWAAGAGWGWGTSGDSAELTTWGVKDYTQDALLELDEWTHVAIVLDADFVATFYVNGEDIGDISHPSGGGPTDNEFFIGAACCDPERFTGLLDEVAVFSGTLTGEQVMNAMTLGADKFDGDDADPLAPLDDGTLTDPQERAAYVHDVLGTWVGDSNLDGEFNSGDLVEVFTSGQYEDGVADNSTWVTGDWSGDGDFDSSDFVVAFNDGGFEQGPRAAAAAVPEPTSCLLLLTGLLLFPRRRR